LYQLVSLHTIRAQDELFRVNYQAIPESLQLSIHEIGLQTPLFLQKTGNYFRIISGFQRYHALVQAGQPFCPARIADEGIPELDLFILALKIQRACRALNALEVSRAIYKFAQVFAITKADLIKLYLPLLGCAPHEKTLELFQAIHFLSPELQQEFANDRASLELAMQLARLTMEEQSAFALLLRQLRLGKNRQHEFGILLMDLCRITKKNLTELLAVPALAEILQAPDLTASQKTEHLKNALWRLRYPRFSQAGQNLAHWFSDAHLPPNVQIKAPEYFADEIFSLQVKFATEQELAAAADLMSHLAQNGFIRRLLQIYE
jgi:hypothetical protein